MRSHVIRKGSLSVFLLSLTAWPQLGCGGRSSSAAPPVILSVTLSNPVVNLTADGSILAVPVIIMAPTETATFLIAGLPPSVSATYKESESNPSGLLTLTALPTTVTGTYMPTISVGSSGQTASVSFTLIVQATSK